MAEDLSHKLLLPNHKLCIGSLFEISVFQSRETLVCFSYYTGYFCLLPPAALLPCGRGSSSNKLLGVLPAEAAA